MLQGVSGDPLFDLARHVEKGFDVIQTERGSIGVNSSVETVWNVPAGG